MTRKSLLSILLCAVLTLTCLASACRHDPGVPGGKKNVSRYEGYYITGEGDVQMDSLELKDIVYRKTTFGAADPTVIVTALKSEVSTGEQASVIVKINNIGKYVYYIVDWGDGTRSFQGPYDGTSAGTLTHAYRTSGSYSVRTAAQSLKEVNCVTAGWSEAAVITVSGEAISPSYISNVRAVSSENSSEAGKITDNDSSSYFTATDWVGLEFDTYYSLDTLEFQFAEGDSVPEDFSVEYTTDRGKNWYSMPRYYYTYEYFAGNGQFYKNLRAEGLNMSGTAVLLDMGGIVANAVRIRTRDTVKQASSMSVSEMRVTCSDEALFYTSYGGMRDADLNNMFTIYGTADTEPTYFWSDPFRSGELLLASAEWIHWNGIKLRWSADDTVFNQYKGTFNQIRSGKDTWSDAEGFIWATGSAQKHLDIQSHYTQNSLFIIEARNYLFMHNSSDSFMGTKNAQRQTIEERIEASMNYLLETLDGKSGILTVKDPENLGKPGYEGGSQSSNYWDRYSAFGYQSSYENIYFYRAVLAYADIKEYFGDTAKAQEYRELAETIRRKFNDTFWDDRKGRYVASVNYEGKMLDFGITFTNFMAASLGLASDHQIKMIYQWLDGERIIESDTSKGDDIYFFGFSARSNTLDFAALDDGGYYWVNWNGDIYPYDKNGAKHGAYGNNIQNGGTIFYTSYYDILGRIAGISTDNAWQRMESILGQFHTENQLRLFPYPTNIGYQVGIIGEFPESGMVPAAFIDGFLGIAPVEKGLTVTPKLPSSMDFAGVRRYRFNDTVYEIRIDRNAQAGTVKNNVVTLPAQGTWILTAEGKLELG